MSNEPEEKEEGDHLIHIQIKIAKPEPTKVVVVPHEKDSPAKAVGDATASKVKRLGSELEKDAVHAISQFKRKGFFVKDSRSS